MPQWACFATISTTKKQKKPAIAGFGFSLAMIGERRLQNRWDCPLAIYLPRFRMPPYW